MATSKEATSKKDISIRAVEIIESGPHEEPIKLNDSLHYGRARSKIVLHTVTVAIVVT